MYKYLVALSILIIISSFIWRLLSEWNIYNPEYKLITHSNSIEIREYNNITTIKTSEPIPYKQATYKGFRTLANYIFGNNKKNIKIPMTAPVITSFPGKDNVSILFIMEENYSFENLPEPLTSKITFEELNLGKVAVVKFGFWATPDRIARMKNKLDKYLYSNEISTSSEYFVAQYNSPWVIPPFRRNEIIVSIN